MSRFRRRRCRISSEARFARLGAGGQGPGAGDRIGVRGPGYGIRGWCARFARGGMTMFDFGIRFVWKLLRIGGGEGGSEALEALEGALEHAVEAGFVAVHEG